MLFQSIFTTAVLFVASTIALPTDLESRQSATTCGSTSYTAAQVRSAVSAGYGDYQAGRTYGSNSYPHKYNNYEGFDFPVAGPYEEFPLKYVQLFPRCQSLCPFSTSCLLSPATIDRSYVVSKKQEKDLQPSK
ncbi:unnamed protein product [Aureobasidium pullulans]|nr:unnamed protein product [Aureobasidium pullulans]